MLLCLLQIPDTDTHTDVNFLLSLSSSTSYCVFLGHLGYSVTFYHPTQPPDPLIISARASNISLTYSVINIFHSESLSEPIRLVSEDLRASGEGTWCLVSDLSTQTNPQSASDLNKCGQPGLQVPKSMEHGKVNMQTATSSYKLEEVVYERLGEGVEKERVLTVSTSPITTLMYRVIVQ